MSQPSENDTEILTRASSTTQSYIDSDELPFNDLCSIYTMLSHARGKQKKQLLANLFAKLNPQYNWFNLLRLLMPNIDTTRNNYGLRETKIADQYTIALGLTKHNDAYKRLKQYKNPANIGRAKNVGDFSVMLDDVLSTQLFNDTNMSVHTVLDVNQLLDKLYIANENSDKELRESVFTVFVTQFTPTQNKWLVRLLLGDLAVGITAESMLSVYHIYGLRLYNACTNLRKVCELVTSGDTNAILRFVNSIEIFAPFKPMLCQNFDPRKLQQLLLTRQYYIENKYDGERLLVHKRGDDIRFYSRNSVDLGEKYKYKDFLQGIVATALAGVDNCIVDCELIALDKRTGRLIPFGNNRTIVKARNSDVQINTDVQVDERTGRSTIPNTDIIDTSNAANGVANTQPETQSQSQADNDAGGGGGGGFYKKPFRLAQMIENLTSDETVCLKAFDLIYLNDHILIDTPLHERERLLEASVVQSRFEFEIVDKVLFKPSSSAAGGNVYEQLLQVLDDSILNGCEGIILKQRDSTYVLNERADKWIKVKPDYVDGLRDNFDCVILGGYYGDTRSNYARRTGDISHLLLGCKKGSWHARDNPDAFYTVGKVGSGYTDVELAKLRQHLKPHYIMGGPDVSRKEVAPWLSDWDSTVRDDIPDVYFKPSNSVVIEVKCAELTQCERRLFNSEITFRFPRAERIRYDKPVADCVSIGDLTAALAQQQSPQSMVQRHAALGEAFETQNKKQTGKRKKTASSKAVKIAERFRPISDDVVANSDVLQGKQFCVIAVGVNEHGHTKQSIEALILENGGTITQNPIENKTYAVLTNSHNNLRIRTLINNHKYDVLHINYLLRAVETRSLLYNQYDTNIIDLTVATKQSKTTLFDRYGDHYTEELSVPTFEQLCFPDDNRIKIETDDDKVGQLTVGQLIDRFDNVSIISPYNMYHRYRFYLHARTGTDAAVLLRMIQLLGGSVDEELCGETTHIVVDNLRLADTNYMQTITQLRHRVTQLRGRHRSKFFKYYVTEQYIYDCVAQQQAVNVKNYTLQLNELHD